MSSAVFRPDLPAGDKGGEADILAVLGIVGDFDDPLAAQWPDRVPTAPRYVLETSAGRFQTYYLLDKPGSLEATKNLAQRLKAVIECDSGTSDMSHVWRVPGCANWPNAKKVANGRPREPQRVLVEVPWHGDVISSKTLGTAISLAESQREPKSGAKSRANGDTAGAGAGTADADTQSADPEIDARIDRIMMWLPNWVVEKITKPPGPGTDRSADLFAVVAELVRRGHDDAIIERLIRRYPTGIGEKYVGRADLGKEIARIREKIVGDPSAANPHGPWHVPDFSILSDARKSAPPFPLAALPPSWREWVTVKAGMVSAPVDYIAWSLMVIAGALIGNARWAMAWDGWITPMG